MTHFASLASKIKLWRDSHKPVMRITGVTPTQWAFVSSHFLQAQIYEKRTFVLCATLEEAELVYDGLRHLGQVHFYPGAGHDPYSSIISSESSLLQRFRVLAELAQLPKGIIVAPLEATLLLSPPKQFFSQHSFIIRPDDIISPHELASKLTEQGYRSASSVEEPGTFCRKGEIFDIYPIGPGPVRLQYFDDLIEVIHPIEVETQKTIKEQKLEKVAIVAAPGALTKEQYVRTFREKIAQPQPQFKERYELRKEILRSLDSGNLFESYPSYVPFFFEEPETLLDQIRSEDMVVLINSREGTKEWELFWEGMQENFQYEKERQDSSLLLPSPEFIYRSQFNFKIRPHIEVESLNITVDLDEHIDHFVALDLLPLKQSLDAKIKMDRPSTLDNRYEYVKSFLQRIQHELRHDGKLIATVRSDSAKKEIEFLLQENKVIKSDKVEFITQNLDEGFIYRSENIFVLAESDLFAAKKKKAKRVSAPKVDLFAEQLSTLKIDDFVIHRDYGIGIYKGLETIKVGDQESDFLVLLYEGNDKVYVPVYRLNLVQKHADARAEAKIASLKSKKFTELKNKARQSVKKLAFDLLRLQAERKLRGGYPFSPPDHLFKEFELSFPFEETPDQSRAINDVLDDMQAQQAMDRLVCGDVGFGKTEVAMRAAFKAVLDKKQVVILVPTTVLALQHFHSFQRRFKAFPVVIEMLSRFRTAKESTQIFEKVKEGKVDILVGTHRALSEKLEFKDLGLVVIDEEHRFGVGHKEKLKVLKAGVDVLTMTATPIPRTMQLAFLGIRDLSVIQTAPPRRQAIKTYLIKEDELTIKLAIEKELSRGGQVFFVHNRVHDIEEVELFIKKLVPKARVSVTHGQMSEGDLEKRINDFYEHRSDILLATTIIESGIDIPNANTMIIDRADTYGLAQLHQLRGRIGRSDRKAYAYFIVPQNRLLSDTANKRLQALQTYADMGSGFNLASADLEIRGAGDILGAEQSGHIEGIGLELYMDFLQEAIQEIKGERKAYAQNVEIQAPFNAFIPNDYISDHALRLKCYKRLSNAHDLKVLDEIAEEISDIYGLIPKEVESLLCILRSRLYFQACGVRLAKVSGSQVHIFFDQSVLEGREELRDKILSVFLGKPKLYKLNPDSSVVCYFKDSITPPFLLEIAKHIAQQIGAC